MSAGDLVGIRLSDSGLVIERVTDIDASTDVGSLLTSTLDPVGPTFVDSAVWTVCIDAPTLFTKPLPPVSDIIAECGFAHDLDSIALRGFDFERWRFDRQCDRMVRRYDREPQDAFALTTLVSV